MAFKIGAKCAYTAVFVAWAGIASAQAPKCPEPYEPPDCTRVKPGPLEMADGAFFRGDYATALRLWRQLAEQGNAKAQFKLGTMYEMGEGVPQDKKEAVKWYQLAAAQGYAEAEYKLGIKTRSTPAEGTANKEQNAVAVPTRPGDMSAAQQVVWDNFDRADCPRVLRTQRLSDGSVKIICSSGEDFLVDFSGPVAQLFRKPVAIRCSAARDIGVGC